MSALEGRILAIDWGKRRLGLAVTDELGITAQGLPTLTRKNKASDLAMLAELIREKDVRRVVVGDPVLLSGQAGKQSREARRFGREIAKSCGVPVEYFDERLTSFEAEEVLREAGVKRRAERRGAVDRIAAVLILKGYLENLAQRAEAPA